MQQLRGPQLVKNSPDFVEYTSLLLHSQETDSCPYPKPYQSNPCPHAGT
jgi:hypothetical protein